MVTQAKLPPIPPVRNVPLDREERQFLEAVLSHFRDHVAAHRQTGEITRENADVLFQRINRISDKIMPEEEAAAILQELGFTIVEKGR